VNIVRPQQSGVGKTYFKRVVCSIITSPMTKGNVVIFSPTRTFNDDVRKHVEKNTGSRFTIVSLDSTKNDQERKAYCHAFKNDDDDKRVVGFSTSSGGEGVDYSNLGLVIVLVSVWSGLLGFHQMCNRVGRGVRRNEEEESVPEVIFLYSKTYMETTILYDEGEQSGDMDRKLMDNFNLADREVASEYVGFSSLESLMEMCDKVNCANRAMEICLDREHQGQESSSSCGKCNLCLRDGWKFTGIVRCQKAD
jgi:superfamily II DNA or RNA helicase